MPAALRPKQEIIERLTDVFRRWGYDAATLTRLSAGTGLVKASLYHYFPNGKQDMAAAVLEHIGARFQGEVAAPFLAEPDAATSFRILAEKLHEFYIQGRVSCLLEIFTLGTARLLFADRIRSKLQGLRDALAQKAIGAGIPEKCARHRAVRALTLIQGSLVVARGLGEPDLFRQQLADLPDIMLAPVDEIP